MRRMRTERYCCSRGTFSRLCICPRSSRITLKNCIVGTRAKERIDYVFDMMNMMQRFEGFMQISWPIGIAESSYKGSKSV